MEDEERLKEKKEGQAMSMLALTMLVTGCLSNRFFDDMRLLVNLLEGY